MRIFDRKIPSVLGITIILLGIGITTFLVKGGSFYQINASTDDDPINMQITNISDKSFTVTYLTLKQVIGKISIGKETNFLGESILDDRDQHTNSIKSYFSHSITASNLNPGTIYYFTITSGSQTISNNGTPFMITTAPQLDNPPLNHNTIAGRAINPDGSIPTDGLISIKIKGAQNLSTHLTNNGTFSFPLDKLRNESLKEYFLLNNDSVIDLMINSVGLSTQINTTLSHISPIPIVVLSNNYDFINNISISPIQTNNIKTFSQLNISPYSTKTSRIIISPTIIPTKIPAP